MGRRAMFAGLVKRNMLTMGTPPAGVRLSTSALQATYRARATRAARVRLGRLHADENPPTAFVEEEQPDAVRAELLAREALLERARAGERSAHEALWQQYRVKLHLPGRPSPLSLDGGGRGCRDLS